MGKFFEGSTPLVGEGGHADGPLALVVQVVLAQHLREAGSC